MFSIQQKKNKLKAESLFNLRTLHIRYINFKLIVFSLITTIFFNISSYGQTTESFKRNIIHLTFNVNLFNHLNTNGYYTGHSFYNDKLNIEKRNRFLKQPMYGVSIGTEYKGFIQSLCFSYSNLGDTHLAPGSFRYETEKHGLRLYNVGYQLGYLPKLKGKGLIRPLFSLNFLYTNQEYVGTNYKEYFQGSPGHFPLIDKFDEITFQLPIGLQLNYKSFFSEIAYHFPLYSIIKGKYVYDANSPIDTYKSNYSSNSTSSKYENNRNLFSFKIGYKIKRNAPDFNKLFKVFQRKSLSNSIDSEKTNQLSLIPNLQFSSYKNIGNYTPTFESKVVDKSISRPMITASIYANYNNFYQSINYSYSKLEEDSYYDDEKLKLNQWAYQIGFEIFNDWLLYFKPTISLNFSYSKFKYNMSSFYEWGGGNTSNTEFEDNTEIYLIQFPVGTHFKYKRLFLGAYYMFPIYSWTKSTYNEYKYGRNYTDGAWSSLSKNKYYSKNNGIDLLNNKTIINLCIGYIIPLKQKKLNY